MKAIVLKDKNEPLVWQDAQTPVPGQGEALVHIKAAAFNHRDLWIQKGQYAGLRYPIMPFGPQAEPAEGMAKSYAGKS